MAISGAQDIYNAAIALDNLAQAYFAQHNNLDQDSLYYPAVTARDQADNAASAAWQLLQAENRANNPVGQ